MQVSNATVVISNYNTTNILENATNVYWVHNSTMVPGTAVSGPSLQTYPERVTVAILWLLIAATNIVGNSIVILAVLFSKKLRTSTNVLVVSLSVADLLTGLALPMSAVGLLSPSDSWPWSTEAPCYVAGLLLYISSTASLFNLASIALNRFILIKYSKTFYRSVYTKRNLAINVVVLWIVAISVMTLPPIFGIGGFGYDEEHNTCSDLDTHPKAKTFERIQTFASYPIPLVVIVTCYVMILIHVKRHFQTQRSRHRDRDGGTTTAPGPASASGLSGNSSDNAAVLQSAHLDRINRQQLEITKNLFMAVCVFFVCITPYCVALFIPNTSRYLLFLGVVFTCNSCANPIIYATKHPQFKKVMQRMLRCKYSEIEEPSDTLKAIMARCKK